MGVRPILVLTLFFRWLPDYQKEGDLSWLASANPFDTRLQFQMIIETSLATLASPPARQIRDRDVYP